MTNDQIERLEQSFQVLAHRGPELVDRFYAKLFAGNPGVRGMFPQNMADQKSKLLASIVLVIKNLRSADKLREPLLQLGARHEGYGVRPEHYSIVRDTLVDVMAEMAGDAWNPTLTSDWTSALNFVASVMLEGHKLAQQKSAATTRA